VPIPNAFEGDAHAFLMAVYKNEGLATQLRMDAAGAAIRYEKPPIAAVAAPQPQEAINRRGRQPDHLAGLLKRFGCEALSTQATIKDVEPASPTPRSTAREHLKMLSERFAAAKRWQ
jgi:hypothetical protein